MARSAATLPLVLLLVFLLVVMPLIELYVIVQVAIAIGVWNTIGLLVLVSLVGAWLVKRQGLAVWQRAQLTMASGRVPGREVVDGVLLLLAGLLLLVPGFISDAAGLLLLLPPVRSGVRMLLTRRWTGRVRVIQASYRGPINTTATEKDRPELGPS
jgi:UPF0716 protein FxsA